MKGAVNTEGTNVFVRDIQDIWDVGDSGTPLYILSNAWHEQIKRY